MSGLYEGKTSGFAATVFDTDIRELENIIERQVIFAQGDMLRFDDLSSPLPSAPAAETGEPADTLTETQIKEREKHNLINALQHCKGKVFGPSGAAEMPGIRPTTRASRLKRRHIKPSNYKQQEKTPAAEVLVEKTAFSAS